MLQEDTFAEPRLAIFRESNQGMIVAERSVLFEVTEYSVPEAIISLLAAYYAYHVSYPNSALASSFLLFMQEILLGIEDMCIKKSNKYAALVNSLHLVLLLHTVTLYLYQTLVIVSCCHVIMLFIVSCCHVIMLFIVSCCHYYVILFWKQSRMCNIALNPND